LDLTCSGLNSAQCLARSGAVQSARGPWCSQARGRRYQAWRRSAGRSQRGSRGHVAHWRAPSCRVLLRHL